ncbi:MAG TPA: hypothetical protein VK907_11385, partial [Phnomibacter sp.]|nr:hypothetical protein [Phnomibacter sp.]
MFTGNWYGRAETKTSHSYNTYLCEMVLTQKGGVVSGKLNYYFGSYEWTAIVAGNIFEETQTFELDPFKLITFFAQNPNGADCQMDGSLTLYTHEADTILFGQFNPYGNHRIGCPVMTVMLKK